MGAPLQIYEDPNSLPVAQRLGTPAINVLPASWFSGSAHPRATHVAIRPEDVTLDAGNGASHFDVIECSLVKHLVVAERDGVEVRARTWLDQLLQPGAPVRLGFPRERCLFFDASGRRLAAAMETA